MIQLPREGDDACMWVLPACLGETRDGGTVGPQKHRSGPWEVTQVDRGVGATSAAQRVSTLEPLCCRSVTGWGSPAAVIIMCCCCCACGAAIMPAAGQKAIGPRGGPM